MATHAPGVSDRLEGRGGVEKGVGAGGRAGAKGSVFCILISDGVCNGRRSAEVAWIFSPFLGSARP